MRARLRRSARPDRIFEVGLQAAHAAGLVGQRRVLDSTPLYDAVATMDTVTLIAWSRWVASAASIDSEEVGEHRVVPVDREQLTLLPGFPGLVGRGVVAGFRRTDPAHDQPGADVLGASGGR